MARGFFSDTHKARHPEFTLSQLLKKKELGTYGPGFDEACDLRIEPNVLGAECCAEFCGRLLFTIVEMKGILLGKAVLTSNFSVPPCSGKVVSSFEQVLARYCSAKVVLGNGFRRPLSRVVMVPVAEHVSKVRTTP